MRILCWSEPFWPHIGGVGVLLLQLLPALQERGYEFAVVTRQDPLTLPEEGRFKEIPVYRFPFWQGFAGGSLDQVTAVRQRIARLKCAFAPDLVHVNSFS